MAAIQKESAYDVYYRHGWVYLVVQPPEQRSGDIYPDEIERRMTLLGMPKVRGSVLRRHIKEATGVPVALVEWPDGERLAAGVTVDISEDHMTATVTVSPPRKGAAPPEIDDIEEAARLRGVRFGIDRGAIASLIGNGTYDVPTVIATGRPATSGTSRTVEYRFKLDRGKPYLLMPFDRINLKELNFIDNRKEGDVLAVLLPPVEAVDGKTVTGERIPAKGDTVTATIPAGENTRLNEEKTELYAGVDGNVRFRDGLVIVEPVVEVENVNYETGNIHFEGSVIVKGSVADGFIIEATGSIEVGKSVGRARLKAGENILLQSGMNGNGEGLLECGGNLFARYLESCTVRCRGNVFVEEAILHSTIVVWNHLVAKGRRAEFIGGDFVVGGRLWCKKLGNIYDVPTNVTIGIPPDLLEEYRLAKGELAEAEARGERLEEQLEQLEEVIREGRSDKKYILAREQIREELSTLKPGMRVLQKRVAAIRDRLDPSHKSVIVAEDMMYSGVVVTFGKHEYRPPQKGSRKPVLRVGKNGIEVGGLDRHAPPKLDFSLPV